MTHFYDKKTQSFYIDDINNEIPDDFVEITAKQHDELHNAINSGCIIFDDLTYSEPPPSGFHKWDGEKWVLDKNKKNAAIIQKNESVKNLLLATSNEKITILQDIIDLDMCESNEYEQLKQWKKYRILVTRVDVNQIDVKWPEQPESLSGCLINDFSVTV